MQTLIEKLTAIVAPSAQALGYNIVQVNMRDGNRSKTLQILAERVADRGMNIDDCAKLSRQLSAVLDVEDLIAGEYRLEISSPGIDRPLVQLNDFEEYKGFTAKIETNFPINGRKRFAGILLGVAENAVQIDVDGKHYALPIADINNAKLVLTDALIKAHQTKYKQDILEE